MTISALAAPRTWGSRTAENESDDGSAFAVVGPGVEPSLRDAGVDDASALRGDFHRSRSLQLNAWNSNQRCCVHWRIIPVGLTLKVYGWKPHDRDTAAQHTSERRLAHTQSISI